MTIRGFSHISSTTPKPPASQAKVEDVVHPLAGLLFIAGASSPTQGPLSPPPLKSNTDAPNSFSPPQKAARALAASTSPSSSSSSLLIHSSPKSKTNEAPKQPVVTSPSFTTKIKLRFQSALYWCSFQKEGWFNKQKIIAEFANLLTRAGTYAANGALIGAIGGTVACPGLGSAVGAGAGALAGFVCGLIVSLVSICLKPLISTIVHGLKDRGTKNFKSQLDLIKSSHVTPSDKLAAAPQVTSSDKLDVAQRANKLGTLLSNCEDKMLNFIYNSWLIRKLDNKKKTETLDEIETLQFQQLEKTIDDKNGDYKSMKTIIEECIVPKNCLLRNSMKDLKDEFCRIVKQNSPAKNQPSSPLLEPDSKDSFNKALLSQFISYNMTRAPSAALASQFTFEHLPGDVTAAIYFPGFALLSAYVSGSQDKTIGQIRKILTSPYVGAANIAAGGFLTIAEFVPTLGEALHDVHTVNPVSFVCTVGIHAYKEYALSVKDIKIKKEIKDKLKTYDSDIIGRKLARIARHDLTKNIPAALNKLLGIIQKSKKFNRDKDSNETLANLIQEFDSVLLAMDNYIYHIDSYYQYIVSYDKKAGG